MINWSQNTHFNKKKPSTFQPFAHSSQRQNYFQTADDMIQFMQLGYFYTIQHIYKTWNFDLGVVSSGSIDWTDSTQMQQQQLSAEQQGETIYMPDVFLIGTIHKLQPIEMKNGDGEPTQLIKASYKTTYDNKLKYLLLTASSYKNNYVKTFNRMMKNKNTKYLFTNLKPIFHKKCNTWQLYFLISTQTYIIHITDQLYNLQLKPIQRILDQDFQFSNIKLSKIYTIDQLDRNCKDGFVLAQIRQKFQNRQKQNITIVGLVNILQKNRYDKNSRGKKQMVVLLTQVLYRPSRQHLLDIDTKTKITKLETTQIGRCKLIIRYLPSGQQYLNNIIVNNHVLLFSDLEIIVTETVNIFYLLNLPKNHFKNVSIFRITSQPFQGINFGTEQLTKKHNYFSLTEIQNLFGITLTTVPISKFLQKTIDRNLVKLQVGLLQVQVIYGCIRCSQCGWQVKKNPQLLQFPYQQIKDKQILIQVECLKSHKQCHNLQLWGTVRAADDTGSCLLSLDHKQLINFLQLYPYLDSFEKFVSKNGKGIIIMNSQKQKNKSIEDDPLFQIKNKIRKKYVEKSIVGFAKIQLDKTLREGLSEQEQMDFQGSFYSSKKYLQHKKIFPNGIIEKRSDEILLLPFVKVFEVAQLI